MTSPPRSGSMWPLILLAAPAASLCVLAGSFIFSIFVGFALAGGDSGVHTTNLDPDLGLVITLFGCVLVGGLAVGYVLANRAEKLGLPDWTKSILVAETLLMTVGVVACLYIAQSHRTTPKPMPAVTSHPPSNPRPTRDTGHTSKAIKEWQDPE